MKVKFKMKPPCLFYLTTFCTSHFLFPILRQHLHQNKSLFSLYEIQIKNVFLTATNYFWHWYLEQLPFFACCLEHHLIYSAGSAGDDSCNPCHWPCDASNLTVFREYSVPFLYIPPCLSPLLSGLQWEGTPATSNARNSRQGLAPVSTAFW